MLDINVKFSVPGIEKLVDYVASGVGAIAGTMLARWQARTAADVRRIEARVEKETSDLISVGQTEAKNRFDEASDSSQGKLDISQEIQERMEFQQQKELSNINNVVGMAAHELGAKEVKNNDVDHDWATRFFSDVKDVSSEQMQQIWAKVLAGEVETPGRTSLRTLSILRDMTQKDAERFYQVTKFALGSFILNKEEWTGAVPNFPTYAELLYISQLGLLEVKTELVYALENKNAYYFIDEFVYSISRKDGSGGAFDLRLPGHALTKLGEELSKLASTEPDQIYLRVLAGYLKSISLVLRRAPVPGMAADKIPHEKWTCVEPLTPDEIRNSGGQPGT